MPSIYSFSFHNHDKIIETSDLHGICNGLGSPLEIAIRNPLLFYLLLSAANMQDTLKLLK